MTSFTPRTFTTKLLALSAMMFLAFLSFAHGQNCTLLPGFSPSTLDNGESRTAYSISGATYTQSCEDARGAITCTNGTVTNGNVYKYPTCIEYTRDNCTTPTGALHLEYRRLYSAPTASYTQTCRELSNNLQCLDGVFTGVVNASSYTHGTCTDPNRRQCIDTRTNSYRDHGESLFGYLSAIPGTGNTCDTIKRKLTCYDSVRSGGNQSTMSPSCTNPVNFAPCFNVWTTSSVPHGGGTQAYTALISPTTGTCANIARPLSCINGARSGNGTAQQTGLHPTCTQGGTTPCPNIISGTGTLPHATSVSLYTAAYAFQTNGDTCMNFRIPVRCTDGTRIGTGYTPGSLYATGCQNVASGSCVHPRLATTYTPHLGFITAYTAGSPTESYGCDSVKVNLYCNATTRRLGSGLGTPIPTPTATYFGSCGGCILPNGGGFLSEGASTGTYSRTGVNFPQSCTNFATTLTCSGGVLNGNRQTYRYTSCIDFGGLTPGVDLAIDASVGIPGAARDASGNLMTTGGNRIAQGSSPQVSILLENKGDTLFSGSVDAGFLECQREEEGLSVYKSKAIDSLIINPGTKLGINIRLLSLFTQSLGSKTLVCRIHTSLLGATGNTEVNDVRSGTFEIVEADRFDLALRRSIDPISGNLDPAQGAKGAQGLQNFIFNNIMNVLLPLIIVLGILSAILGFYKLMFSSDENATKEGTRYIIYGVIGIIIIMSAKFIGQNVFDLLQGEIVGKTIAQGLYENILFPFIKLAIYLVLGVMFVLLVSRVITFLFGSDADAQKKAGTLIGWNVISMFVIIGAKQIVETIYGKQDQVLQDATNLGEIGSGILADKNIPILYHIINYALGIASLVILVIIILQTIKLLMKPDDPAQIKSLKNSLFYMFLGILVLGAGYLIVNFAIIN